MLSLAGFALVIPWGPEAAGGWVLSPAWTAPYKGSFCTGVLPNQPLSLGLPNPLCWRPSAFPLTFHPPPHPLTPSTPPLPTALHRAFAPWYPGLPADWGQLNKNLRYWVHQTLQAAGGQSCFLFEDASIWGQNQPCLPSCLGQPTWPPDLSSPPFQDAPPTPPRLVPSWWTAMVHVLPWAVRCSCGLCSDPRAGLLDILECSNSPAHTWGSTARAVQLQACPAGLRSAQEAAAISLLTLGWWHCLLSGSEHLGSIVISNVTSPCTHQE